MEQNTKKSNRFRILLILIIIVSIVFGIFGYFLIKSSSYNKNIKPYENEATLKTGQLIQKGFDNNCQETYNKIIPYLNEFEQKILSQNNEINKVNNSAGIRQETVSSDVLSFVKEAHDLSYNTEGYYDITIGALRDAFGFSDDNKKIPNESQINSLLKTVDISQITFNDERSKIGLNNMGTKLDFSGLLAGHEIDCAIENAKSSNLKTSFAAIGNQAAAYGKRPDNAAYAFYIPYPDNSKKMIGNVKFEDCGVATCGIFTNAFEFNGDRYWDIIDPKSGKPANNGLKSVTVLEKNASYATVLSRELFVRGDKYLKENLNKYRVIAIDNDDNIIISDSVKDNFEKNDDLS